MLTRPKRRYCAALHGCTEIAAHRDALIGVTSTRLLGRCIRRRLSSQEAALIAPRTFSHPIQEQLSRRLWKKALSNPAIHGSILLWAKMETFLRSREGEARQRSCESGPRHARRLPDFESAHGLSRGRPYVAMLAAFNLWNREAVLIGPDKFHRMKLGSRNGAVAI